MALRARPRGGKAIWRLLHIAGYMWRKEGVGGRENVSVKLPTAAVSFQSKHSWSGKPDLLHLSLYPSIHPLSASRSLHFWMVQVFSHSFIRKIITSMIADDVKWWYPHHLLWSNSQIQVLVLLVIDLTKYGIHCFQNAFHFWYFNS